MKRCILIGLVFVSFAHAEPIFIENKGQWPKEVLFQAKIRGGMMRIQEGGFRYLFWHYPDSLEKHQIPESGQVVETKFLNSKTDFRIEKLSPSTHYHNYFYGSSQENWASHCYGYQEIWLRDFYPDIDLRVFSSEKKIKYEFWVKPKGNVAQISWIYKGADRWDIEDNRIKISHRYGNFFEDSPLAWTIDNQLIEVGFAQENGVFRYQTQQVLGGLVIDPTLIFSTFSAAASDNWGNTATYGENGQFYSGGTVSGSQFPATNGAFDQSYNGGESDVVILKFDSAGKNLLYATYLGGNRTEVPHSLILNAKKELVVLGTTSSSDFPTTANAYDRTFNGGNDTNPMSGRRYINGSDIFVSLLSADGSTLVGSTYLGGIGNDGLNHSDLPNQNINNRNYGDEFRGEVIVDNLDRIYLACVSQSSDFPTTAKALQKNLRGSQDGVLVRFSDDLKQLQWSSYWGGSGRDMTYSLKIGSDNRLYVGGGTSSSTDFPTTSGALHTSYRGGSTDGFISKFNLDGDTLLASTYLGTNNYDQVYFIDIDPDSGQVVAFGQSLGSYPITSGTYRNVGAKQFLHSLKSNLTATEWSTVFGSNSTTVNIVPTAFLVNECSKVFVAGWGGNRINRALSYYLGGFTTDMPTTTGAFQRTSDGEDFYLGVFDKGAKRFLYGTFMGGTAGQGDHVDGGTCRFDKDGVVYHSVCSCGGLQNDFPTTPGAFSRSTSSDNCTIASFKFDMNTVLARFGMSSPDSLRNGTAGCLPYSVNFIDQSLGGERFIWDFGDGTRRTFTRRTNTSHTYRNIGIFPVSLSVIDSVTCKIVSIFKDTVKVFPNRFFFPTDTTLCKGQNLRIDGAKGDTTIASVRWSPGKGLSDSTAAAPVFFGESTTSYNLTLTNIFGCSETKPVVISVTPQPEARFEWESVSACDKLFHIRVKNTSKNAEFFLWNTGLGAPDTSRLPQNLVFPRPGIYPVGLFAFNGNCADVFVANVIVEPDTSTDFAQRVKVASDTTICRGDSIEIFATGGSRYSWTPREFVSDTAAARPKVFPQKNTTFRVKVFGKDQCFVEKSVNVSVRTELQTQYELSPSYSCGALPTLLLKDKLNNASRYSVEVSDGQTFDFLPDLITFKDAGDYTLTLVAADKSCSDTRKIQVRIENYLPYNVFSPNGDGKNETFFASSSPIPLKVFNRWGQMVYQSQGYQNDWAASGLDDSVFYYEIQLPNGQTCKGWVTVLR